ncbi:MAG: NAD(P)-dependent oxidoreductase [Phycisphaerales bacterium]
MKVLIADKFEAEGIAALEALGCAVTSSPDLSPETMGEAIRRTEAEVLVVRSTKVPAGVIDGASTLKAIIRAGAGYDNIDTDAAAAKGIPVCNCPGMNAVAVAELTIGMLIALDRRLPEQDAELRGGSWNKKEYGKARGLKGRTLLVVGTGSIGTEVIKRAKALEMKIVAQSRSLGDDTARALGIEPLPYTREAIVEALKRADAVTIHVASTPDTQNLCGPGFFGAMKPGAYFINTSRGDIVDEKALAHAVETKGIRAALDVYQDQPGSAKADWRPPLADVKGIIHFSHHCGASTDQAQMAVADETVRIVKRLMETGKPLHVVNGVGG